MDHYIELLARAMGMDESYHPLYNAAIIADAKKAWEALLAAGFVEDRVDIGASGHMEALVLMLPGTHEA